MSDLDTQLHDYFDHVVERVEADDVRADRAVTEPVRPLRARFPFSQFPGWAYAVAAAVVVLAAIGGVGLLLSPADDVAFQGSTVPTPTIAPTVTPDPTIPTTVTPEVTIPVDATPDALGGTWTVFGVDDGLPGPAYTVAVSPDGTVWSAHLDRGDFSADGYPLQLYRYDTVAAWQPVGPPLVGVSNLQWIAEDADGSVVAAVCVGGATAWHLARFADDVWEVFEDPAMGCGPIEVHTMPDGSLSSLGTQRQTIRPCSSLSRMASRQPESLRSARMQKYAVRTRSVSRTVVLPGSPETMNSSVSTVSTL